MDMFSWCFTGVHSHSNNLRSCLYLLGDWSNHRQPPDRAALRLSLHSRRVGVLFPTGCLQAGQRLFQLVINLSLCVRKPTIWFPTRSDTNRPVQSQK